MQGHQTQPEDARLKPGNQLTARDHAKPPAQRKADSGPLQKYSQLLPHHLVQKYLQHLHLHGRV